MPFIRSTDTLLHQIHGVQFHAFANSGTGSKELAAWRGDVPAGTAGAPHTVTREEVMLILRGALLITIDGEQAELRAGDSFVVNPGSKLSLENRSGEPAQMWVVASLGLEAVLEDGSRIRAPWAQ
jgi:mannose-6-phosphate isomerase-like protein (cupin superfamily)